MAHNLCTQGGKVHMMYVEQAPWHGLGTRLDKPATAAEAIGAAHLDWRVSKKPLYLIDGPNREFLVPDRFAVVREDRMDECFDPARQPVLGVVSDAYTPLQNAEAFEFFDAIVGQDAAIYHTAGALGNGERVWVLAKLPSNMRVVGDDIVDKYLLLVNSHDGSTSVQIRFTPIRVVCQNTLMLALQAGPRLRVPHTRDLMRRLQDAQRSLGLIHATFDQMERTFKAMQRVQVSTRRLHDYLSSVFPEPAAPADQRVFERVRRDRELCRHLFAEGAGSRMPGVRGTLWAAYNGVTELVDHAGSPRLTDQRRLQSAWFGQGYLTKARAYQVANEKARLWAN